MRQAKYIETVPVGLTSWQNKELEKAAEAHAMSKAGVVRLALKHLLSKPSNEIGQLQN